MDGLFDEKILVYSSEEENSWSSEGKWMCSFSWGCFLEYIKCAIWIPRFIVKKFDQFSQLPKSKEIENDFFFIVSQAPVSALLYAESKVQEAKWILQYANILVARDPNSPLQIKPTTIFKKESLEILEKKSMESARIRYEKKRESFEKESLKAYCRLLESMFYLIKLYLENRKVLESKYRISVMPLGIYSSWGGLAYSRKLNSYTANFLRFIDFMNNIEANIDVEAFRKDVTEIIEKEGLVLKLEAYISSANENLIVD